VRGKSNNYNTGRVYAKIFRRRRRRRRKVPTGE